jgi:hypothetical protein
MFIYFKIIIPFPKGKENVLEVYRNELSNDAGIKLPYKTNMKIFVFFTYYPPEFILTIPGVNFPCRHSWPNIII